MYILAIYYSILDIYMNILTIYMYILAVFISILGDDVVNIPQTAFIFELSLRDEPKCKIELSI